MHVVVQIQVGTDLGDFKQKSVRVEGVYGPFAYAEDAQAWVPTHNDGYIYVVQSVEDPTV